MLFVRKFNELSRGDVAIAGGKGASLGEMTQAGIPVPDGFVVLSSAFEQFIKETGLNVEIDAILDTVKHEEVHTVEEASEKIQSLILNVKMPEDIEKEILISFKKLNSEFVAVRSSATSEDSASAAWAGQLDSFLNTTKENLLENVQKCWASLFTPRAIFYRFEKDLHKEKISVAVVVQKMVNSEKSGIAFSVHPVTQDYNQIIIEAGFGLGEAIVSGQITPDSYVVNKKDWKIIDVNVNEQEKGLFRKQSGGNEWRELGSRGEEQVLNEKEIVELSKLIVKIEEHYGFPVDVEWAFESGEVGGKNFERKKGCGKFYIVQSRPITTLTNKQEEKDSKNTNLTKLFTREHALFTFLSSWGVEAGKDDQKWIGVSFSQIIFLKEEKIPKVSIWYDLGEFVKIKLAIKEHVHSDKNYFKHVKEEFYKYWNNILPYASNKEIKDVAELKKLYPSLVRWWPPMGVIYLLPDMEDVSKEIKDEAKKIREEFQDYADKMDNMFVKFFRRKYPQYKELTYLITPQEVFELAEGKLIQETLEKIKARSAGYVAINRNVYPIESLDRVLDRKNLELEKIKIEDINEIKGFPASPGIVKGKVRIIKYKNQISTIEEGEILVTEMTSPDFLPAMKKSAAIVTDEGGITSHAAIVSRELGKPCVIGTQIATEIIRDGDLVEVDADNGIVKILEKAKEKRVFSKEDINIEEWEFEFQQRNEHPILMADFWCRALYKKYVEEINLPVELYDYFFTTSSKGYVKTAQKKITLETIKKAFDKDNTYSIYLYNQTIKRVNELETTAKYISVEINKDVPNKKLVELWKKFDETFLTLIPWYWIPYYPIEQNLLSDKIKENLVKYKDKIEKITDFNNAFMISMSPTKEMAFKEEQKDFFDLVKIAVKKDNFSKDKTFNDKAKEYLKKYSWMNTFILLPIEPLTLNELIEKIKNAIDEKSIETYNLQEKKKAENDEISKRILQIIGKDKELLVAIENIKKIGWVLTWSVETSLHTLADLQPFFKLIAKKLGVSYSHWIHLTSNEIVQILEGKKNLEEMELKEREKGYFFMMEKGIQKMVIGQKGKSLSEWVEKNLNKVEENITELKGQSACSGHAKGSVRIALIAKDSYKLKDGEILVCAMTSPDYVPAMKRASAIITDEGGMLCHAAIMSREFGKPCVIATKIATRVLKDGDLVEVDAEKGIIKILESSQK